LLKSPHIGLPHDLVGTRCNPAATETSVNCWANNVDPERATSPVAITSQTRVRLNSRGDELPGRPWPSVFIFIAVASAYYKVIESELLTAKCQRFSVINGICPGRHEPVGKTKSTRSSKATMHAAKPHGKIRCRGRAGGRVGRFSVAGYNSAS
jgi:hypothetical protein